MHRVCEVFTPRRHWGEDDVGVICSDCQEKFEVSPPGFNLLEHRESIFGTMFQRIQSVSVHVTEEPFLSSLGSRLARQEETLASVWTKEIHIEDKSGADTFMALLEADTVNVERILVYFNDDIGEETWHRLAGNLRENPDIGMDRAYLSREVMVERMKDDIKSIWDATGGRIYLGGKEVQGSILVDSEDWADWEAAWAKLKEISNMTPAEFKAEAAKAEELRQVHEKDLNDEKLRQAHEEDPEDSSSPDNSNSDKESEVSPAVLMAGTLRREVSLDSSSEESSEEEKESNHAPQSTSGH